LNNRTGDQNEGIFIVVSAPSGTGKTPICRELLRLYPDVRFSVSYTTRPPRPGETDGRDYHFVTAERFRRGIAEGEFAEWAENYGHYYGTSRKTMEEFRKEGFDLVVDVEPRGAKALKAQYGEGTYVFILPPSIEELKKRLRGRGCESEEIIARRLEKALDEIREVLWYDYVIFNDRLDEAVERLKSIYLAEKSRRDRQGRKVRQFVQEPGRG